MTITTAEIVTMLIGVVAPLLVGLLTRSSTPSGVKAALLALISAAVGIGQGFLDNPAGTVWDWQHAVFYGLTAWVVAVATHYGLWKAENAEGNSVTKIVQGMLIKDEPVVMEDGLAP